MGSDTGAEVRGNSFDLDRPAPKPAAEREAAIGRYAIRGYKECSGRDGVAFSLTLLRDGEAVAKVIDEGCGGGTLWRGAGKTKGDFYLRAGGLIDEIEADAVAWFVGSDAEKNEWQFMDGRLPRGCRDIMVEELIRREDERKWLMKETRGAKKVLFQVGDDIGGQGWKQYVRLDAAKTPKAVEAAKGEGKGKPVRVVWRDGKTLRDETFGE